MFSNFNVANFQQQLQQQTLQNFLNAGGGGAGGANSATFSGLTSALNQNFLQQAQTAGLLNNSLQTQFQQTLFPNAHTQPFFANSILGVAPGAQQTQNSHLLTLANRLQTLKSFNQTQKPQQKTNNSYHKNIDISKSQPKSYHNSQNRPDTISNLNRPINKFTQNSPRTNSTTSNENSNETSYLKKVKTSIDANRRNINHSFTANNHHHNQHKTQQSQNSQCINSNNNSTNNEQYRYKQNKQLIVIKPNDETYTVKRPISTVVYSNETDAKSTIDKNNLKSNEKSEINGEFNYETNKKRRVSNLKENDFANKEAKNGTEVENTKETKEITLKQENTLNQPITIEKKSPTSNLNSSGCIIRVKGVLSPFENKNVNEQTVARYDIEAFYCRLCGVVLNDEIGIKQHLFTLTHRTQISSLNYSNSNNQTIKTKHEDDCVVVNAPQLLTPKMPKIQSAHSICAKHQIKLEQQEFKTTNNQNLTSIKNELIEQPTLND